MRAKPEYMPSPRQIARKCRSIQRSWTPAERQRRIVGFQAISADRIWLPPQVNTSLCHARVRRAAIEMST